MNTLKHVVLISAILGILTTLILNNLGLLMIAGIASLILIIVGIMMMVSKPKDETLHKARWDIAIKCTFLCLAIYIVNGFVLSSADGSGLFGFGITILAVPAIPFYFFTSFILGSISLNIMK